MQNVVDGQFSMPFCAAVALREGQMTWDDYAKHIDDAQTLALCAKVSTRIDADASVRLHPRRLCRENPLCGAAHLTDPGAWPKSL